MERSCRVLATLAANAAAVALIGAFAYALALAGRFFGGG